MERKLGVFLWLNVDPVPGQFSLLLFANSSLLGAPTELGEAGGLSLLSLLIAAWPAEALKIGPAPEIDLASARGDPKEEA
jgi:hypothetical protein